MAKKKGKKNKAVVNEVVQKLQKMNVSQPKKKAKKSKTKSAKSALNDGSIRLTRTEALALTVEDASFVIKPATFSWLKKFADMYTEISWNSLRVRYVSATSTSTSGAIYMGFGHKATALSYDKVANLSPFVQATLWKDAMFSVPRSALMPDAFMPIANSAGNILVAYLSKPSAVPGSLMVTYDVTLSSPI